MLLEETDGTLEELLGATVDLTLERLLEETVVLLLLKLLATVDELVDATVK